MNTFAKRLKYAMEQADLKQSALSEQAGISKAAISQYLSGKNTPNQERIKALADVTGVTFDFLMGYGAAPVTDAAFWDGTYQRNCFGSSTLKRNGLKKMDSGGRKSPVTKMLTG